MASIIESRNAIVPYVFDLVKTVNPGTFATYRGYLDAETYGRVRIKCLSDDTATRIFSSDITYARFGPEGRVMEEDGMYLVTELVKGEDGFRLTAKNRHLRKYEIVVSHNWGPEAVA